MPDSESLRELLLSAELITEDQEPNSSDQYLVHCYDCNSKKMFIDASDDEDKVGLAFCQKCSTKANYKQLKSRFGPKSEEQEVYSIFHEYAVRQLIKNDEALSYILDRDFSEDDIADFGYGYAGKNFKADLIKLGVTEEQLKEYGFLKQKQGKWYPVFWNHVIISYKNNGEYQTFKGRSLDKDARIKYISLSAREIPIYGQGSLHKSGRVFLTEGEFKRDYAVSNGYNAAGISGAGNAGKFIKFLRSVEDLWIVLDADEPTTDFPDGCGQTNAVKIAQHLDKCHIVYLPRKKQSKVGWDDYLLEHSNEEFDQLCEGADYYIDGEKQKSQSLAVIVQEWKRKAIEQTEASGFDIGFPRLDDILRGAQPGSLCYAIAAPHAGKTTLLRSLAYNVYDLNEDVHVDYYTNDDSIKETMPHFVAMIGELNSSDSKEPMVSYANNKAMMKQWDQATRDIEAMSHRFKILDRSFNVSLEDMYEQLMRWREKNPDGRKAIFLDGFSKIRSIKASKSNSEMDQVTIKSDQLKIIAQQADIFVMSTIEPPKLYGKRPSSWDIKNSGMGEFDATIILSCYIDAQVHGVEVTDLKMPVQYEDDVVELLPIIEVQVHKNKQTGMNDLDLFILHKNTSALEELEDSEYVRMKKLVTKSQIETKK
jgi:replicative DNA helicase/transcription elongation factor Elf1